MLDFKLKAISPNNFSVFTLHTLHEHCIYWFVNTILKKSQVFNSMLIYLIQEFFKKKRQVAHSRNHMGVTGQQLLRRMLEMLVRGLVLISSSL